MQRVRGMQSVSAGRHFVSSQGRLTPFDKSEGFSKSFFLSVILLEHFRFPVIIALIYQETLASRGAVFFRAVITAGMVARDHRGQGRPGDFLQKETLITLYFCSCCFTLICNLKSTIQRVYRAPAGC